jgi:hypothetical protein
VRLAAPIQPHDWYRLHSDGVIEFWDRTGE